jgi:hypothetical protein
MSVATPGAQLRAVYDAYVHASRVLWDIRPHGARSEVRKADLAMRAAAERFNNLKAATRDAFAKSRGWRYDRKRYAHVAEYGAYGRRIIKHPEFFRDAEGTHVGMVTHSAATPEEAAAYAARHGYNAELLPFSWDNPVVHIAVLFTLKAGAIWPQ